MTTNPLNAIIELAVRKLVVATIERTIPLLFSPGYCNIRDKLYRIRMKQNRKSAIKAYVKQGGYGCGIRAMIQSKPASGEIFP